MKTKIIVFALISIIVASLSPLYADGLDRPIIKGAQKSASGGNETYDVNGAEMQREDVVKKVESGEISGYHIYERNGKKYIRDNPDSLTSDNVNQK